MNNPDPFLVATAESCSRDIVELILPQLSALRDRLNLNTEQFTDLVITVAYIVRDAMIRTGEMAKDVAVDTLTNDR